MDGISVVIPCYNAAAFLRETLESVLSQDYAGGLEVLVADDDSTDGSREIAEAFGSPVRVLPHPPKAKRNASAARNRCIQSATQPLVAFLDADDLYLPGHLKALAEVMCAQPELGLAYDKGYDFDSNSGRIINPRFTEPHEPRTTPDKLMREQCYPPVGAMVRRSVFDQVGLFDETLKHSEDHDMWLRILEFFPAAYVPFDGFMYRQHENQKSLKPTLWPVAATVFENACKRYPYQRRSIRKRKAVLTYHFSELAKQEGRPLRAAYLLSKAAMLDPVRAGQEALRRLTRKLRRPQQKSPESGGSVAAPEGDPDAT